MNKTDNEIIDEILKFMYYNHRNFRFSDLNMIPRNKIQVIKDKLFIYGLVEKERITTSYSDDIQLTNKTVEIMVEYGSFISYINQIQSEKSVGLNVNIIADNGSSVNIITGDNNSL